MFGFSFFRPASAPHRRRRVGSRLRRLVLERLEDRSLLSATLNVSGTYTINSYAGVGFQENEVATLAASVNGEPDTNKGDFQAQIQWGDGATSNGDLVFLGTSGSFADYMIKGSHIYTEVNSSIAITVSVTGPSGSSASEQTAFASVSSMPSGIPGTAPAQGSPSQPDNVVVQASGTFTINSYRWRRLPRK